MPESPKNPPERTAESSPARQPATTAASDRSRGGEKERPRRDPSAPVSVVGIGASAGGVQVLQQFFAAMPVESGLAFVVVMHLSPDHTSNLAEILQARTKMPVIQVNEAVKVERHHVYVIPPNKHVSMRDRTLVLSAPQREAGRRVTIDLFFRTLAEHFGQRAVGIILSGTNSDGVIGLKHIKAQGGVTIAQDPAEAEHDSMPRHAIETGVIDWILPVNAMPARLLDYVQNEKAITLPPEKNGEEATLPDLAEGAGGGPLTARETTDPADENALRQVLAFLRSQTGRDFSHYKRATVLRRIARRLQVNSLETLPSYLEYLRTHPGEAGALLHDLLINVTHFFRDPEVFAAFEANIPQLFAGREPNDQLRVWVPACATGEEAYSIAILLCEQANRLEKPPAIQIFATDVSEEAVQKARDGIYPSTIEADVSGERLRRYFAGYHGQYRIKKEVRELVLFAPHDLLRDSPFSRLDLISCRNLLIYLKPEAQHRALDIFHFALRPGGLLVLGNAESVDGDHAYFASLDKRHRIYVRRNTARLATVQLLSKPRRDFYPQSLKVRQHVPPETVVPRIGMVPEVIEGQPPISPARQRLQSLSAMHVRLFEAHGPASVIVDENYDIIHMSARAGTFLRFSGGEPSANLLQLVDDPLRLELRTALFRAGQNETDLAVAGVRSQRDGELHLVDFHVWPAREAPEAAPVFLVMLEERSVTTEEGAERAPQAHEPVTRHLEEELRQTREQLHSTIAHHEATNEELKASNEELQAMNEEMRSATEELETSKEELQSVNEELTTLNQELKSNVEELNQTNSDLQNLIASTDIATIFLDVDLCVSRFTPRAQELFSLIPGDVGRPLSDIRTTLLYPGLIEDAAAVLSTLEKIEREVPGARDRFFLARLSPYRSLDDRINGVVIAFVDTTRSKRAEEALQRSEEEFRRGIEEAPIPMIMQSEDGQVLQISRSWAELTGYTQEEIPTFDAWLNKAYGFGGEDVRERMRRSFHGLAPLEQVEFAVITRNGGRRFWNFSASHIGVLRDGRRFTVGMALDVTERKEAADKLRESEERFRAMITQTRSGMAQTDLSGRFIFVNERYCEITGYAREELWQLRMQDITAEEDLARNVELFQRLLETGEAFVIEKRYLRKDGSIVWVENNVAAIRDEHGAVQSALAVCLEISERKRAEEALRESQERYQLLVEGAPDYAMFMIDPANVIIYWSAGAERVFGWSADEAVGCAGYLIFTPEDRARKQEQKELRIALENGMASDRRWHMRKDGSRVWIDGIMRRLDDEQGQLRGFAKIGRDATELHQAEEELRLNHRELESRVRKRTAQLTSTNKRLQTEMKGRAQLEQELLLISEREKRRIGQDLHDSLCQELAAAAFFLQTSSHKMEKANPAEAKVLAEAAKIVNANVGLARDLARGLHPVELTSSGLTAALHELAFRTNSEGLECEFICPRSVRVSDEAVALNLYRIAQEALTNAIKNGHATKIAITLERRRPNLILTVVDNGKGFSVRRPGRRGLGLHIMKYRAHVIGGDLTIESSAGHGARIKCTLPS